MNDMGLVVRNKKMLWSSNHGALRWCSYWVRQRIARTWNFVACRLFGHNWYPGDLDPDFGPDEWFCCDCCKVEVRPERNSND